MTESSAATAPPGERGEDGSRHTQLAVNTTRWAVVWKRSKIRGIDDRASPLLARCQPHNVLEPPVAVGSWVAYRLRS